MNTMPYDVVGRLHSPMSAAVTTALLISTISVVAIKPVDCQLTSYAYDARDDQNCGTDAARNEAMAVARRIYARISEMNHQLLEDDRRSSPGGGHVEQTTTTTAARAPGYDKVRPLYGWLADAL